jgi:hypothetical protein
MRLECVVAHVNVDRGRKRQVPLDRRKLVPSPQAHCATNVLWEVWRQRGRSEELWGS